MVGYIVRCAFCPDDCCFDVHILFHTIAACMVDIVVVVHTAQVDGHMLELSREEQMSQDVWMQRLSHGGQMSQEAWL
jgi:hypothetical protein